MLGSTSSSAVMTRGSGDGGLEGRWIIAKKDATYQGDVNKNGQITGKGIYTTEQGDRYAGDFKANKFHGSGTYRFYTTSQYTGEFKDGKYHGQGKYVASDGSYYSGTWVEGRRHGPGLLKVDVRDGASNRPIRISLRGIWTNDQMTGIFIETRNDRHWRCLYEDDLLKKRQSLADSDADSMEIDDSEDWPENDTEEAEECNRRNALPRWFYRTAPEHEGIFHDPAENLQFTRVDKPRSTTSPFSDLSNIASSASTHSSANFDAQFTEILDEIYSESNVRTIKYKKADTVQYALDVYEAIASKGNLCSEDCLAGALKKWGPDNKRHIGNKTLAASLVSALVKRHMIGPFPVRNRPNRVGCDLCS